MTQLALSELDNHPKFFQGTLKDAFTPRQQQVNVRTRYPPSQEVGWIFFVAVSQWVLDICHCLGVLIISYYW